MLKQGLLEDADLLQSTSTKEDVNSKRVRHAVTRAASAKSQPPRDVRRLAEEFMSRTHGKMRIDMENCADSDSTGLSSDDEAPPSA